MSCIRTLDPRTAKSLRSQISITSAADCISEVVQNALDASATVIHISVFSDPISFSISDNGCGISFEDLSSIGQYYATSKCHTFDALSKISTFGFRGEALASLCSLATVTIISRQADSHSTQALRIGPNSERLYLGPANVAQDLHSPGTVVRIHNLFASQPVREKSLVNDFLSDRAMTAIRNIVIELSLLRPDVEISLHDTNSKTILHTGPSKLLSVNEQLVAILRNAFGHDLMSSWSPVSAKKGSFTLNGVISSEGYPTRAHQYIFVNNRRLLNGDLLREINKIFTGHSTGTRTAEETDSGEAFKLKKYPAFVIKIQSDLSPIDICQDPKKVLVTLEGMSLYRRIILSVLSKFYQNHFKGYVYDSPLDRIQDKREPKIRRVSEQSNIRSRVKGFLDKKPQPGISTFFHTRPRLSNPHRPPISIGKSVRDARYYTKNSGECDKSDHPTVTNSTDLNEPLKKAFNPLTSDTTKISKFFSNEVRLDARLSKKSLVGAQVIAQIDRKFILFKSASKTRSLLICADQHAVDERIRLEKYLHLYHCGRETETDCKGSLYIIPAADLPKGPIDISLSESDLQRCQKYKIELQRWGIWYDVNQSSILVYKLPPTILTRCANDVNLLKSLILQHIHSNPRPNNDLLVSFNQILSEGPRTIIELLNSRACRSSIMFGDTLTIEECSLLIQRLSNCLLPFQCAHGRPSLVPLGSL